MYVAPLPQYHSFLCGHTPRPQSSTPKVLSGANSYVFSPCVTLPLQGMQLCLVVRKNLSGMSLKGVTMVMFSSSGSNSISSSTVSGFPFAFPEKVTLREFSVVTNRSETPPLE